MTLPGETDREIYDRDWKYDPDWKYDLEWEYTITRDWLFQNFQSISKIVKWAFKGIGKYVRKAPFGPSVLS